MQTEATNSPQDATPDAEREIWIVPQPGVPQVLAAPTAATARRAARVLLAEAPGLTRREALSLALAETRHKPREAWEWEMPLWRTISRARAIVRGRALAAHSEALGAAYERVCGELAQAGTTFEMLAAWHRGERPA